MPEKSVSDMTSIKIQKYQILKIIMTIKIGWFFFHMILKDIDLAIEFQKCHARLCASLTIFCKTQISTNIFLYHDQAIEAALSKIVYIFMYFSA